MSPGFSTAIPFHKTSLYYKKRQRLQHHCRVVVLGGLGFVWVWGFCVWFFLKTEVGEGRSSPPTPGATPFPEQTYAQQDLNPSQTSYVSRVQSWLAPCPIAVDRKMSPEVARGWVRPYLFINKPQLLFQSYFNIYSYTVSLHFIQTQGMTNGFVGTILTNNVGRAKQPWRSRWQLSSWRKATGKYAGAGQSLEHWFPVRVARLGFTCRLHDVHTSTGNSGCISHGSQCRGSLDSWGCCGTAGLSFAGNCEEICWRTLCPLHDTSIPVQVSRDSKLEPAC